MDKNVNIRLELDRKLISIKDTLIIIINYIIKRYNFNSTNR